MSAIIARCKYPLKSRFPKIPRLIQFNILAGIAMSSWARLTNKELPATLAQTTAIPVK
jgi:hypothetical protein